MNKLRMIVLIGVGIVVAGPALGAQERSNGDATPADRGFAPAVPLRREMIDAFIAREVPIAERTGVPVRIVRLGHAGTLERPEALELPEEGGWAFPLYRYDWLRANERDVEIRLRGSFTPVVVVEPAAQVIVVSRSQMELLFGTVAWKLASGDGTPFAVTAGSVAVRGRGGATLQRDDGRLSVFVTAGRFDVYRDGEVAAILGAGQQRTIAVPAGSTESERSLAEVRPLLQSELDGALEEMRGEAIGGERLATLWELTRTVGAIYAPLEETTDPRVDDPDIVLREIAEALRILAAYQFLPPPARGM